MDSRLLLSLGYPIGVIDNDNGYVYQLEAKDGKYTLDDLDFAHIWTKFINGANYFEIKHIFLSQHNINETFFDKNVKHLINEGFIIDLEHNCVEVLQSIKNAVVFRQGWGTGITNEENCYNIFLHSQNITIDRYQYMLWTYGDRKVSVEDIYYIFYGEDVSTENIEVFIISLIELATKGLVYLLP